MFSQVFVCPRRGVGIPGPMSFLGRGVGISGPVSLPGDGTSSLLGNGYAQGGMGMSRDVCLGEEVGRSTWWVCVGAG